jgi:hypothetical protein
VPQTSDPANFDARADTLLGTALPAFRDSVNTWAGQANSTATTVNANAVSAAADAASAANSSAAAVGAANYVGNWADLTGALAIPASVGHSGKAWLLLASIPDVTASEPSSANSDWVAITPTVSGAGGTINADGNVTLTSSSDGAQVFEPLGFGQYVTLPDATTMTEANNTFFFENRGAFDLGVKDGAGNKIGWLLPKENSMISLADNSTAAGEWTSQGLSKIGKTMQFYNYDNISGTDTLRFQNAIELDADRTLLIWSWGHVYGVVYDSSDRTFGSPLIMYAAGPVNGKTGIKIDANSFLMTSHAGTSLIVSRFSVTGKVIAQTGQDTLTTTGSFSQYGRIHLVNDTYCYVYTYTSGAYMVPITISGANPVIGTPQVMHGAANSIPVIFVDGVYLRVVIANSSTLIYVSAYTASAGSITRYAAQNITTTSTLFKAFINGAGNLVVTYLNGQIYTAISVNTSGVEAVNIVQTFASIGGFSTGLCDTIVIDSTRHLVIAGESSTARLVIVTDTTGTPSKGSEIEFDVTSLSSVDCLILIGTKAYCYIYGQNTLCFLEVECSGATPDVVNGQRNASNSSAPSLPVVITKPADIRELDPRTLISGDEYYTAGQNTNFASRFSNGRFMGAKSPVIDGSGGFKGETNDISYLAIAPQQQSNNGVIIERLECVE